MAYVHFIWTDEIIAHIAEHGISPDDFEHVVCHPASKGLSRSTGLPVAWGHTGDGRYIMVVYEQIDRLTVLPVTAYEATEPR
jgi:hypothetical protein